MTTLTNNQKSSNQCITNPEIYDLLNKKKIKFSLPKQFKLPKKK